MSQSRKWNWNPESAANQIAPDIWLLDLGFQGRKQIVAAYLLVGDQELALIECGPSSTLANLEHAVAQTGNSIQDISKILVTHIHLDHAGAAGPLARSNSEVNIHVHPFGAPHLVDPSKLATSAKRIYEDQMEPLWGEIVPIPESNVASFEDGESLTVAGRTLKVLFTPGHAWHHVALLDKGSGIMFTGDVGAVRMPGHHYVCPPAPPPDLDLDAWAGSIARIESSAPDRLALTHFGVFDNPDQHLAQIMPNLERFVQLAEQDQAAGESGGDLTRHLEEQMLHDLDSDDPEVFTNYNWASPAYMAAMGIGRYLRKRMKSVS